VDDIGGISIYKGRAIVLGIYESINFLAEEAGIKNSLFPLISILQLIA